jgi:fatty acid CoA ligase FadD9
MFSGYYRDPEATKAVFSDGGWFHTGDVGELDPESGRIKIIDRKKNVIKLAQGEFVTLEKLENHFAASALFNDAYVHANPLWSFITAAVVPSDAFVSRLPANLRSLDRERMCNSPEARKMALSELAKIAVAAKFQAWEIPRAVVLFHEPFSAENGLLTSTGKRRRLGLQERFGPLLNDLIEQQQQAAASAASDGEAAGGTVAERIERLIVRVLGSAPPSTDADGQAVEISLRSMGMDSMVGARFVSLFRQTFGITVPVTVILDEATTVGSLARIVESGASEQLENTAALVEQLQQDCQLDPLCIPPRALPEPAEPQVVLLTGANGFLGCHLLYEILRRTCARVVCLARASDDQAALQRVLREAATAGIELSATERQRISGVAGDLAAEPYIGVGNDQWQLLASTVDTIVHCGAFVNHVLSYSELKQPNVNGTKTLIQLACTVRHKRLHFISSIGVLATSSLDRSTGLVTEQRGLSLKRLDRLNGYIQSKWVAEHVVGEAKRRGLVATISRPAFISGNSRTGHYNVDDSICRLLRSFAELGIAPHSESSDEQLSVEMSPVDYVASGIVLASWHTTREPQLSQLLQQDKLALPRIFHPIHPNNVVPVSLLVDAMRQSGFDVQMLPLEQWRTRVADTPNAFQPLAATFSFQQAFMQLVDRSQFYASCRNELPPQETAPSQSMICKYIQFLIRQNVMPHQTHGATSKL